MSYKLIAIDLDDTLLGPDKKIIPENALALRRAAQAGIEIVLASGRVYSSIKPYSEELGLNSHTIAMAGAQLLTPDGQLIYSTNVPPAYAKEAVHWAHSRGLYYQLYRDDGMYYINDIPEFRKFYSDSNNGLIAKHDPSLLQEDPLFTYKLLIVDTPENIRKHQAEASEMFPDLRILISQSELLEFLNPETSKGAALAFLAEKKGLSRDEIMAIGDSEIDISMIEYAGTGVAVANSVAGALKAADFVSASNVEGGVAQAINKFLGF